MPMLRILEYSILSLENAILAKDYRCTGERVAPTVSQRLFRNHLCFWRVRTTKPRQQGPLSQAIKGKYCLCHAPRGCHPCPLGLQPQRRDGTSKTSEREGISSVRVSYLLVQYRTVCLSRACVLTTLQSTRIVLEAIL